MKNLIALIAVLAIAFIIYKLYPSNQDDLKQSNPISSQTESVASDETKLADNQKSKDTQNQAKGIQPKNDLEQIWFENDETVPVSEYFEELLSESDNGNPIAKMHLMSVYFACFNMPENEEQLNKNLSNVKNENRKHTLIDNYVYCEGYPRDKLSRKDVRTLVMEAARAGHPVAKREFAGYAFEGITEENMIQNADAITDLKKEAFQHLLDARNLGDSGALLNLGMMYQYGDLTEQNPVEAYAHYYAFHELNPSTSDRILTVLERDLTQKEVDLAIKRGEQYAQCCD